MTTVLEMRDNFRLWLSEELAKRGWSQSELARRSHITQASISDIINGKQMPGDRAAVAIAHAFGYPLEEVRYRAGLTQELPDDPATFQMLIARAASLDPADIPLMIDLIDRLVRH